MKPLYLSLLSSSMFAFGALAQTPTPTQTPTPAPTPTARATPSPNVQPTADADNTARNANPPRGDSTVADQQPNNESELKLLQAIRKAIIDEKSLSMDAKNCKVVVSGGMVTLRGPVDSSQEMQTVADIAMRLAGNNRVTNNLEVKAPRN